MMMNDFGAKDLMQDVIVPQGKPLVDLGKISLRDYKAQHSVFKSSVANQYLDHKELHWQQVCTKPNQRLITWSDKNILSVSLPDPVYSKESNSYTYPLLLIDPNFPNDHTLLHTPHKSSIINHSWTPLHNMNLLLTVDGDSTVCLWKSKSLWANDLQCFHQLQIENAVCVKWIYSERRFSYKQVTTDEDESNMMNKFDVFTSHIKALPNGTIAFIAVLKTGHVQLHYLDTITQTWCSSTCSLHVQITKADVTVSSEGSILVAVTQRIPTFTVHAYEFELTRAKGSEINISLCKASSFSVHVVHQVYAENELSTISCISFLPFCGNDPELLVISTDDTKAAAIEKWKYSTSEILHSIFYGEEKHERKKWFRDSQKYSQAPICMEISQDKQWVAIGYLDGKVELCAFTNNFELVNAAEITGHSIQQQLSEDSQAKRQKKPVFPHHIAVSPNGFLIAVFDSDYNIRIFSVHDKMTIDNQSEQLFMKKCLETSIVNAVDAWDLFYYIKKQVDWGCEKAVLGLPEILSKSLAKLNDSMKRSYSQKFEKLESIIYRFCSEIHIRRLVRNQLKRYFQCISELYRAITPPELKSDKLDAIDSIDNEAILQLIPYSNWFIETAFLFYKAIQQFIDDLLANPNVEKLDPKYYLLTFVKTHIFVSTLRDTLSFAQVIVTAYNKKNLNTSANNEIYDAPLLTKPQLEGLTSFYTEVIDLLKEDKKNQQQQQLQQQEILLTPKVLTGLTELLQSKNELVTLCNKDIPVLLRDLDIVPNLVGNLQTTWQSVAPLDDTFVMRDCITRQKILPGEMYKVCKTCNRSVTVNHKPFAERWAVCCPLCEGYWKIVIPPNYNPNKQ